MGTGGRRSDDDMNTVAGDIPAGVLDSGAKRRSGPSPLLHLFGMRPESLTEPDSPEPTLGSDFGRASLLLRRDRTRPDSH
jgi:hypothetical protein